MKEQVLKETEGQKMSQDLSSNFETRTSRRQHQLAK